MEGSQEEGMEETLVEGMETAVDMETVEEDMETAVVDMETVVEDMETAVVDMETVEEDIVATAAATEATTVAAPGVVLMLVRLFKLSNRVLSLVTKSLKMMHNYYGWKSQYKDKRVLCVLLMFYF
ncbi:unnamed protein product [Arabidopsis lyrata]|nr:unnamed protein product [Arabidopsis lyrata]